MMHAPLLSQGCPDKAAPIISWIDAVPDSAPLPDTSPLYDEFQCIVQLCSRGGRYTPQSHPSPPFPAPPQWVVTPMSYPVDVWFPCPPSAILPGDGNPQGISPYRESLPTPWTQIEAPLAPPPHKTSLPFTYPLPPSPKYFPVVPIFPALSVGSFPPPANRWRRTTTFVPSI